MKAEKSEKRTRKSKKGAVWEITYTLVKAAPEKKRKTTKGDSQAKTTKANSTKSKTAKARSKKAKSTKAKSRAA